MGNKDKEWLVKSNDLINGPYEFNEVVENIFKGDVHLLDEIQGPFERWRPIRDHSLFAAAIEKLKATTYSRREVTITETVDLGTHTVDLTQTSTETFNGNESTNTATLTNNIPNPNLDITSPGITLPDPPKPQPEVQRKTTYQPQPVRKQKSHFPIVFLVSFLVIAGGAVYVSLQDFKKEEKVEKDISNFDKLTDQGLSQLKVGRYQEALSAFQSAYEIRPDDPNLILEMSPLLIQFDGQYGKVQVMVENLLATRYQKEFMKKGKNIVGMSLTYRGQYDEAIGEFDKSLNIDDQYYPALVNKAFALLKVSRGNEAITLLQRAIQVQPREAMARYLLTRALIQEGYKTRNKQYFSEAISTSNEFAQSFSDLRQEVLFLIAIAKMQLEAKKGELVQAIRAFLSVDVELTSLHVHNVDYDFQTFDWRDYDKLCQTMTSKVDQHTGSLLKGFCLLKSGNFVEAKSIFESMLAQKRKDGILQSLYASTLFFLNDVAKAKNTLSFVSQMEQFKPFVEVYVRGCLQAGDLECVEKVMKTPYGSKVSLLYSHWALAELNHQLDKKKMRASIVKGLSLSPHFGPLLELRREL